MMAWRIWFTSSKRLSFGNGGGRRLARCRPVPSEHIARPPLGHPHDYSDLGNTASDGRGSDFSRAASARSACRVTDRERQALAEATNWPPHIWII